MVTGCHFDLLEIVNLVLVRGYDGRVEGLDDARVTHLAVLVAPIGVVVDASRQVIHLLRHGSVLTALGRSTEGDQFETAFRPLFLSRNEVTERVVFDTFTDDTFVVDVRREAVRQLGDDRPSVRQYA